MNYRRIVVFGTHADDEMNMSGTLYKLSQAGCRVCMVTMADGSEGYPRVDMRDQVAKWRRREAAAADRVLGIARRVMLDCPDMGVTNDKATLHRCIAVIREERPEAVFTHGPVDLHRDHLATHRVTLDAVWHAGQPVSAALGPFWQTPYLYYYVGCPGGLPRVDFDVTDTAHKRLEALATQISQHTLFRKTRADFLEEARAMKKAKQPKVETFYLVERVRMTDFPSLAAASPQPDWPAEFAQGPAAKKSGGR
jgi:LmbE family N-acetylglucosaminyl deacetylase